MSGENIIECVPVDFERIKYNSNLNWKVLLDVAKQYGIDIPKELIPKDVEENDKQLHI